MKQIFFNNRALILCNTNELNQNDPESVIYFDNGERSLKDAVDTFDKNSHIAKMYISSDNTEATYNQLRLLFTEITAAGGLVKNSTGEYLFIHRNGRWDLPKGKMESGESHEETAIREVMEECGISTPKISRFLCETLHTYHFGTDFVLKHSFWYAMTTNLNESPIPQTEEGITEALWIPERQITDCTRNTYPTIRKVLASAGLI